MSKNSKNKKSFGISVIIPCYNVEKYIENCLDSLIQQLNGYEYEIILIDDCSKDDTKKVINKYLKNHDGNLILLENKNNLGAGASRNKALKQAKYEYISFVDADDYVDDNFFKELLELVQKENSDIAVCDFNIVDEKTGKKELSSACEGEVNNFNLINNGLAASPCNKIIKKEYLIKYPFAEGIMNEDVPCILSIIANCSKVSYTDKVRYNYVQHQGSVQNSHLSIKKLDIISAYKLFLERIKDNDNYNELRDAVMFHQIICFLLYVPSKEENFWKRARFLRAFAKKLDGINIRGNHYYWNFIDSLSGKTKMYYKLMIKLITMKLAYLASFEIQFYKLYASIRRKKVVFKSDIDLDDVVAQAKKQQKLMPGPIKVSVIVPNYNYERFMYQRIYSILSQNYKIEELIILDDCSKDDSIAKIDEIVNSIKEYVNVRTYYNETNSGSAFKQWKKGMELATGDYIWIAEADDFCEPNLLKSLIQPVINNRNIMLSYADTAFIDTDGHVILKSIKPEIDIQKSGHWNCTYVNNGLDEIKNYSYLNCTIANVSSCIIKNGNYEEYLKMSGEFRQAGDWLFYVNLISNGDIAFYNKPLNYYRVHGSNVSSTTNYQRHLDEINRIHSYFIDKFDLTDEHKKKMKERVDFLKKAWKLK